MTICSNCSFEVSDTHRFCSNCGHNLGGIRTKVGSMKARMEHAVKTKVNEIKHSLDARITDYLYKVDKEQELMLGDVRIPDNRRDTIRNALESFQRRLKTEEISPEEFSEWMEDLRLRLDEEKCIVCFQNWLGSDTNLVVCKHCQSGGHELHLVDWVRENKFCPLCRQSLRTIDLISVEID